jgi:hypothetical protein
MDAAARRGANYFLDVWQNQVPSEAKPLMRDLARRPEVTLGLADADHLRESILALERRHILRRHNEVLCLEAPLFGEYVRHHQSLV